MNASATPSRREYTLFAIIVVVGFVLRVACMRAEFWLDEIWSWEFSRLAHTPWDIILRIRHDNNHILNTLALWAWPSGMPWPVYRMHSLVAGTLAIAAAWQFARSFGMRIGLFVALIVAVCPWFVWSSAEARGYAMVVLCTFLAAEALRRTYAVDRRWAVGFWAASVLGVLAHPTFLHASVGFAAWSLVTALRERGPIAQWKSFAWAQGPVVVVFAAMGLTIFANRAIGGAPPTSLVDVVLRLSSVGLGGPADRLLGMPWTLLAVAGVLLGIAAMHRQKQPVAWLFIVTSVCMPLFVVLIQRPTFLFERYLFVCWALGLVPLVLGIESVLQRCTRQTAQHILILATGVMLLGDAYHITRFAWVGRGDFIGAARWILAHDDTPVVRVTGNLPMRVEKYVRFYGPYLSTPTHRLEYVPPAKDVASDVEWLLMEGMEHQQLPGPVMRDNLGSTYNREWASPARGIGSWNWAVYRRAPAA